jgi:hypothetical protein
MIYDDDPEHPIPRTKAEYDDLWSKVVHAEIPDPTPHGMGHDHCPYCGADWKQAHRFGCVSPYRDEPPGGGLLEHRQGDCPEHGYRQGERPVTAKTPTPEAISALLAEAAHPRAGQVPVSGGWSSTDGFEVSGDPLGVRVLFRFMRILPQHDPSVAKAALRSYARTITLAGWAVDAGEYELTVTAPETEG